MEIIAILLLCWGVWYYYKGRHKQPSQAKPTRGEKAAAKAANRARREEIDNAKKYKVGIVGESNYQDAIEQTEPGEPVDFFREPDNPHDEHAVVVTNMHGQKIGYLARDSWVRRAIVQDGKPCCALIKSIKKSGGNYGVVLDLSLAGDAIGTRPYEPS